MPRHPVHRGWQLSREARRRRTPNANLDAAAVFEQLKHRVLSTLDDCRRAWEHGANPLAVCVAVTKCDTIPEWLQDAVLGLLTSDRSKVRRLHNHLHRLWKRANRDEIDAYRAGWVAAIRSHPDPTVRSTWPTWPDACRVASENVNENKHPDFPSVGPAGIADSYKAVRKGLENPGKYYCADATFQQRLNDALRRTVAMIESGGPLAGVEARRRDRK